MFVVEQYGYALRSCYKRWPFQELPKLQDFPRKNDSYLQEVFEGEEKFLEVFCDYEDLFPEYSRGDFYWRLIWESEKKRNALFTRLENVKEQFESLLRTVAKAEDEAEAERKGIKKWKDTKTPPQARSGEATETLTYQWEIDRNTRKITLSTSRGVETYKPERKALFSIFEKLWDNEGTPVSFKELCKVTKQERGYTRDYVVDLKNGITKQLNISRDVVEKIIARHPLTGKIKTYTFHKNPS